MVVCEGCMLRLLIQLQRRVTVSSLMMMMMMTTVMVMLDDAAVDMSPGK